jgi:hypothetical protein
MWNSEGEVDRVLSPRRRVADVIARLEGELVAAADLEDRARVLRKRTIDHLCDEMAQIDLDRHTLNYLYWYCPEIGVTELGLACGIAYPNAFVSLFIDPIESGFDCTRCGQPVLARSRSEFKTMGGRRRSHVCHDCLKRSSAASHKAYAREREERAARLNELKSMPYAEYLRTPEWQETRKAALRRARYACQVCNGSGVQLDVHHRTYERRGEEYARDVVVLCHPCHETFHKGRSLHR